MPHERVPSACKKQRKLQRLPGPSASTHDSGLHLPGTLVLPWGPADTWIRHFVLGTRFLSPGTVGERSKKMCPVFWKIYLSALLSPNVLEPRHFHGKED